uniref:Paternally-expressed gene 3 protein n=1 Tax=Bos taurus TaxID=9913 RepID=PEG3_BOVIN|nr:RecName: Full=Paternally-expressed gene 3 protein [Bos taurus]AAR97556.1 paternally expressed gene 3 [Bos taurus]
MLPPKSLSATKPKKWAPNLYELDSDLSEPDAVPGEGATDSEFFHQRFRNFLYVEFIGPRKTLLKLRNLCLDWLQPEIRTKEEIIEVLVLEQYLSILPERIKPWVYARKPETCEKLVALLEDYEAMYEPEDDNSSDTHSEGGMSRRAAESPPPRPALPCCSERERRRGRSRDMESRDRWPSVRSPRSRFHQRDLALPLAERAKEREHRRRDSLLDLDARSEEAVLYQDMVALTEDRKPQNPIQDNMENYRKLLSLGVQLAEDDGHSHMTQGHSARSKRSAYPSTSRGLKTAPETKKSAHRRGICEAESSHGVIMEKFIKDVARSSRSGRARESSERPHRLSRRAGGDWKEASFSRREAGASERGPEGGAFGGGGFSCGSDLVSKKRALERKRRYHFDAEGQGPVHDPRGGARKRPFECGGEARRAAKAAGASSLSAPPAAPSQPLDFGAMPYVCDECGRSFAVISEFVEHQIVHTRESLYEYGESFIHSAAVSEAQSRPEGARRSEGAQAAGLAEHRGGQAQEHLRGSGDEEQDEPFLPSPTFSELQKMYGKDKFYECKVCKETFLHSSALIEHQKIHSHEDREKERSTGAVRRTPMLGELQRACGKEKRYECKVCGETFHHSAALREHQKTHGRGSPSEGRARAFEETFIPGQSLKRRQKTYSKEKLYDFREGGDAFGRSSDFMEHQKIHSRKSYFDSRGYEKPLLHSMSMPGSQKSHTITRPPEDEDEEKAFTASSSPEDGQEARGYERSAYERAILHSLAAFRPPRGLREDGEPSTYLSGLRDPPQKTPAWESPYAGGRHSFFRSSVFYRASRPAPLDHLAGEGPSGWQRDGEASGPSSDGRQHQKARAKKKNIERKNYDASMMHSLHFGESQTFRPRERFYECLECGEFFVRSSELAEHQKIHNRKKLSGSKNYLRSVLRSLSSTDPQTSYQGQSVQMSYPQEAAQTSYAELAAQTSYAEEPAQTSYAVEPAQTSYAEEPAQTSYTEAPAEASYTEEPAQTSCIEEPAQTSYTNPAAETSYAEEPAQTSYTEAPAEASYTEEPAQTSCIEEPAQTSYTNPAAETSYTEEPAQTSYTEAPAEASGIEEPAQTNYTEESAEVSYTEEPSQTSCIEEPAQTSYTDPAAETSYTEEPAQTSYTQEPAQTSCTEEPAQTSCTEEPAQTSYTQEPAQTSYTKEPAEASYTEEPAQTSCIEEPAQTNYTKESAKASYTEEPAQTSYTDPAAETSYTEEPAQTNYTVESAEASYTEEPSQTSCIEEPAQTSYTDSAADTSCTEEPAQTSCTEEPAQTSYTQEPAQTSCTEEPAQTSCTEEPAQTSYTQEPAQTSCTEEPAQTSYTQEPAQTSCTEEPAQTSYTEEPAQTSYTEEPAQTSYTQEPAQTSCTEEPAQTSYTEEPAQTSYTEEPAQTSYTQEPAQTSYTEEPAQTSYTEEPAQTSYAQEPAQTSYAEEPAQTSYAEEPAQTSYAEEPAQTSYTQEPAQTNYTEEPAEASYTEEPAQTSYAEEPAQTSYPEEPAQTSYAEEPAQTSYAEEPAQTSYPEEPAQTSYTEEPAQTSYAKEPAQTSYPEEPAQTSYAEEPAQTSYAEEPAQTSYAEEPAQTSYSEEPAQTRYTGNELRSDMRKNQLRPDMPRNQLRPVMPRNQLRPDMPRNQPRPVILRNQLRPDMPRNQPRPVILRNQLRPDMLGNQLRPDMPGNQLRPDMLREPPAETSYAELVAQISYAELVTPTSYAELAAETGYFEPPAQTSYTEPAETNYADPAAQVSFDEPPAEASYADLAAEISYAELAAETSYADLAAQISYDEPPAETSYAELAAQISYSEPADQTSYAELAAQTSYSEPLAQTSYAELTSETSYCEQPVLNECKECGECFATVEDLGRHQKIYAREKFHDGKLFGEPVMQDLGLDGSPEEELEEQEEPEEPEDSIYGCKDCGLGFADRADLRDHQKVHGREYLVDSREYTHPAVHMPPVSEYQKDCLGEQLYECPACGESFVHSSFLFEHQKVHEQDQFYGHRRYEPFMQPLIVSPRRPQAPQKSAPAGVGPQCQVCGQDFIHASVLSEHARGHAGEGLPDQGQGGAGAAGPGPAPTEPQQDPGEEQRYECETCGESFPSQADLQEHMRVHEKGEPYDYGAAFVHTSFLTEPPKRDWPFYECKDCGKSFIHSTILTKHQKLHLQEEGAAAAAAATAQEAEANVLVPREVLRIQGSNVEAAEPEVEAAEPEVEAAEPEVEAAEPLGEAEGPEWEAAEPSGEAEQPHAEAEQPDMDADEPDGAGIEDPEERAEEPEGDDDEPDGAGIEDPEEEGEEQEIQVEEPYYDCGECGETFPSGAAYAEHLTAHASLVILEPAGLYGEGAGGPEGGRPDDELFKCDVCGQLFSDRLSLARHQNTHTG